MKRKAGADASDDEAPPWRPRPRNRTPVGAEVPPPNHLYDPPAVARPQQPVADPDQAVAIATAPAPARASALPNIIQQVLQIEGPPGQAALPAPAAPAAPGPAPGRAPAPAPASRSSARRSSGPGSRRTEEV